MKVQKQIWILFLTISINLLQAQSNSYRISGLVKSEQNQNVEFGNVIALSIKDSALIKGGPFQDGTFNLGPLNNDSILLKVTSVGYSDFFRIIIRSNTDSLLQTELITLLQGNSLSEITVTAKTPMFEADGEKVKVNVENTALNNAGNALDVLKRSPGVNVSTSDIVSVFGKGTAIIYLDGMIVSTVDILKALPSTDIKTFPM